MMVNKALFLDRDGVINYDYGYVHSIEDFVFVEGIFDLVIQAVQHSYEVFVVTNQAGIGRGYYTESQFQLLSDWMCGKFMSKGVEIRKVYYCPNHPVFGVGAYKRVDSRRKPGPGMFADAASEFQLSMADSILIGDKMSDIEAGLIAGVGTNILLNFNDIERKSNCHRFDIVSSLHQAKKYIDKSGSSVI